MSGYEYHWDVYTSISFRILLLRSVYVMKKRAILFPKNGMCPMTGKTLQGNLNYRPTPARISSSTYSWNDRMDTSKIDILLFPDDRSYLVLQDI